MGIPEKRKKETNVSENFSDEGTHSDSKDEDVISIPNNDLIEQILKICRKTTAYGCIGCHEIKHLIESLASSPDSGFQTASSQEPKHKKSSFVNFVPNHIDEKSKFIKTVITDDEKGKKLKSNKRKRTAEKFSQRKRAKVDLIANQKKNDKIFNKLLDDYRSNNNSPIVSIKHNINKSENNSKEKLPQFDLDGNEILEEILKHGETEPKEFSQKEKLTEPSKNRHSMSSIDTRPVIHSKRKSLRLLKSTTQKNKVKCSVKTKSKKKIDFDELVTEKSRIESSGTKGQEKLYVVDPTNLVTNSAEFDLDGNEIIKNDEIEHQPEKLSQSETFKKPLTSQYSLKSINTLPRAKSKQKSLPEPIRLDFETSTIQKTKNKKELESTNLVEFDLDGNEIVQQGESDEVGLEKRPDISQSEKFIKPKINPYSLRSSQGSSNTVPEGENCNKNPYEKCKQKLDFDESRMQKPKAKSSAEPKSKKKLNFDETNNERSKLKRSKIPKKNLTSTTVLPSLSLKNICATATPARTLYDQDAFIHSAMFDSMFQFEENK